MNDVDALALNIHDNENTSKEVQEIFFPQVWNQSVNKTAERKAIKSAEL